MLENPSPQPPLQCRERTLEEVQKKIDECRRKLFDKKAERETVENALPLIAEFAGWDDEFNSDLLLEKEDHIFSIRDRLETLLEERNHIKREIAKLEKNILARACEFGKLGKMMERALGILGTSREMIQRKRDITQKQYERALEAARTVQKICSREGQIKAEVEMKTKRLRTLTRERSKILDDFEVARMLELFKRKLPKQR